jgi:hypothetical protein
MWPRRRIGLEKDIGRPCLHLLSLLLTRSRAVSLSKLRPRFEVAEIGGLSVVKIRCSTRSFVLVGISLEMAGGISSEGSEEKRIH